MQYISKFQDTIKALLRFYSKSGKRLRELSAIGKALDSVLRQYGKWNSTRWIASKARVMKALDDNWTSTIMHLREKAASSTNQEASTAKGLLQICSLVRFITFLGFMCDFTLALSNLSEAFQSDHLSLSSVLDELDATLGYLEQLKPSPGIIYARFLSQFDSIHQPTSFCGLNVTGGKRGFNLASSDIETLTVGAITYIQKQFAVTDILKHFYIFDPTNWPTMGNDCELITAYGREEMAQILSHFELLFDSSFCQKVMDQWLRLKLFVCKRVPLVERQAHILWPRITTQDSRFSSVMKVVSIYMLLPMSTAVCERGFSLMNRIKLENRGELYIKYSHANIHKWTQSRVI